MWHGHSQPLCEAIGYILNEIATSLFNPYLGPFWFVVAILQVIYTYIHINLGL